MTATTELTPPVVDATAIEQVLIGGDLARLTAEQRLHYYRAVCESVGLNPLTRPLEYLTLNGKLILYARRDATEQLRRIHGVSIRRLERDHHTDLYVVTAYASDKAGREDASTGAVSLKGLTGEALANALMKAETKAKRRVTLSICGLGVLDESEATEVPPEVPPAVVPTAAPAPAEAATEPPKPRGRPKSIRDDETPITRSQQKLMFRRATEKQWSTDQLRQMLVERFGTDHTSDLRRGDFDQVLMLIQRGPTPDNTYPASPSDDAVPF